MDRFAGATSQSLALYRAEQVQAIDRRAIAAGTPGFELMSRAGAAAFALLQERWPHCTAIEVFCGGGNNGGDGYVVAALAAEAGLAVRCWALSDRASGDANIARELARDVGVEVLSWQGEVPQCDAVVVDALLGTGFTGSLREEYRRAIAAINASACPVLAVDLPSGLYSNTGMHGGIAVEASLTLSFIAWKQGMFTGLAGEYCGERLLDGLGVDEEILAGETPAAWRTDIDAELRGWARRPAAAHKGMYGHVLVAGGDHGMAGAVVLAAAAAARSGAGLVSCATRPEHITAVLAQRPEVMVYGCQATMPANLVSRATVLVLGPGLGQHPWGQGLLEQCLAAAAPILLDADALNLIAAFPQGYFRACERQLSRPRILTPHPGEAARLLGCSVADVQSDRFASCRELARRYRAVALLKGWGTVVSDGDSCWVVEGGNPGMASGGMGDVLSGMIASLLAQGLGAALACRLAAGLHARAADRAAAQGERGLLAMDVVEQLRGVMNAL